MNNRELSQLCDSLRNLYQSGINIDARDNVRRAKWKVSLCQTILRIEETSLDYWLGQAPGTANDPVTCMNPWPQLKSISHSGTTMSLRPPEHNELLELLSEVVLFLDAQLGSKIPQATPSQGDSQRLPIGAPEIGEPVKPYRCFTHTGLFEANQTQYRELIETAHDGRYDLFIDASTGEHGLRPAGATFVLGDKLLSPQQASYLTELVELGRPVPAEKLTKLDRVKYPKETLRKARRKVEFDRTGRDQDYRIFKTVRGGIPKYMFAPPEGISFLVIRYTHSP